MPALCKCVLFSIGPKGLRLTKTEFHRRTKSWLGAPFPKAQFKNVGYGRHSLPEDWDLNYSGAADPYESSEEPTSLLCLGVLHKT